MKEEKPRGTDPEACAYLYSVSLEAPMGHDWTQIYLYIAGKVAARAKNAQSADDIKMDSFDDYQTGLLRDLKDWIYRHRVKVRQERRRAEKAQGLRHFAAIEKGNDWGVL